MSVAVLKFRKNSLGRRVVAMMILASALLSTLAALAQIRSTASRDPGSGMSEPVGLSPMIVAGLEAALASNDPSAIGALLDETLSQNLNLAITLEDGTGRIWQRGQVTPHHTDARVFPLHPGGRNGASSATLTITFAGQRRGAPFRGFLAIMSANFLQTAGISLITLVIFEIMVSRHLSLLAADTHGGVWETGERRFRLNRGERADELGQIVTALNEAGQRIRGALKAEADRAAELQTVNDELRQANQEQAEFTFAVSHDLKSPSNTIGMLIDELIELHGHDPGSAALLSDMKRTNLHMLSLVEDIQSYSLTVRNGPAHEEVDLVEIVGGTIDELASNIAATGTKVQYRDLPTIRGNRAELRILFENLIENAVKFHQPGRQNTVCISGPAEDSPGPISISDNGIGISPDLREKVFGLFQKLHARDEFEGTGLGLAICRRIMANHGGVIRIAPDGPPGTTFELEFWRKPSEHSERPTP